MTRYIVLITALVLSFATIAQAEPGDPDHPQHTVVLLVTDNPTDRLIAETSAPWWVAIGGYDARAVDASDPLLHKVNEPELVCFVTLGANAEAHAATLRDATTAQVVAWSGVDRWDTARGAEQAIEQCSL